jgi:hypothetical protein
MDEIGCPPLIAIHFIRGDPGVPKDFPWIQTK